MNDKYKKYLFSDEWAQLKIDLYNHRGRKCERCGSEKQLQVHHLHYKNIFKEEPQDLLILCKSCHQKEHKISIKKRNKRLKKKRSLVQKVILLKAQKRRKKKKYYR